MLFLPSSIYVPVNNSLKEVIDSNEEKSVIDDLL